MCVVQGNMLILTKTGVSPPTPTQGTGPPAYVTRDDFGWGKQWWAPFGRAAARNHASIAQASTRALEFLFSPQILKPLTSAWANLILVSLFCSVFVWLGPSSSNSSSRNPVSPLIFLNFTCCKEAIQAKPAAGLGREKWGTGTGLSWIAQKSSEWFS